MIELTIKLTEDKNLNISANRPLSFEDTVDLTLSTVLAMMNATLADTPEDKKEAVKEYLFQAFNISASALLAQFAPDIELRPDITEEAILQAELDIASKKLRNDN